MGPVGKYAGDAAWSEWFAICSVGGCSDENRARLRAEVESAMFAQLARFGLSREDAGEDDLVAFFDGYFKLKGSREKGKPLKLYFAHRIRAEHLRKPTLRLRPAAAGGIIFNGFG